MGLAQQSPAWTKSISLQGEWRFALDPNKEGVEKRYFNRELSQQISLPGSTDEAKLSPPNTNKPTLDGLYQLYAYEGPAWYQRDVEIPGAWKGKQVSLFLERTHWDTTVWVDDKLLGTQDSLIAPHIYDLGTNLAPGRHRLTICVDNTRKFDLGPFVSINYAGTQTNWNGLIGKLELRARDPVSVADVEVYPEVDRKLAKVSIVITNDTGEPEKGNLTIGATGPAGAAKVPARSVGFTAEDPRTVITVELPMGRNPRLWDEFSPALYKLTVSMRAKPTNLTSTEMMPAEWASQTFADHQTVTFGMRKFATRGTQFTMNGRPVFLRGTLECAIFPLTGYPPTDVPSWQRIYRIIKSYGLNFIRFHSWCPPEAAFAAADIEGVMVQAEGPQANVPAGRVPQRDAFMEQELLRMIRTYGNHPSFCLMTLGNEYGGPAAVLSHWVDMLIKEDPRHLYSSASSAQITANRQFTERDRPRGVQGPGTDMDFREAIAKEDRPLIGHEIGQWTFFPNFDEARKYTGVLAAKNFDLVRDDLAAKHLLALAPRFVQATGRHAVLLYKEEIEILLRTPGHAGFSLLDLHDYPGQGTALIGALDPFWDSKGFVTPEAHRRYCGATVPLLRMKKRTFTTDEIFTAEAEIAHFGAQDLTRAQPVWVIRDESGNEVASGAWAGRRVSTGKLTSLGSITALLADAPAPAKLTVTVSLQGTAFANDWDIWVYPANEQATAPADVVIARNWDVATKAALASGKKVILFPQVVNPAQSLPGRFLPVFWSPVWFPKQQPNTMGILCEPRHRALAQFPTEFYSDWQWYELLENSRSVNLSGAPPSFRPIVEVIDNFSRNNKLGNLFEARVGAGSLLVCTMDLLRLADTQPAAKQLLISLYAYAGSESFTPSQQLDTSLLDKWFSPSAPQ
jgi:hypothetical protein